MPPRALVTGASGYIGARLIAALLAGGVDVVATSRDPATLERFDYSARVHTVSLDTTDEVSCRTALREAGPIDVAYYLVHAIGQRDYAAIDERSAANFAAAAAAENVGRIVYLGGFVPDGQELSEHLQSRAQVGEALESTGVDTVWLRAAVILGAGSTSFELVRYLADRLPAVPLPTWMQYVVAPIAVDDVLRYLLAAADPVRLPAGAYDIANDEVLTYADVIKRYAALAGLRRLWLPMIAVSPEMAAPIVARLTPIPGHLTADLVLSLHNTMNSDDHRIRRLVPDPAAGLTSLDNAIRRALVIPDPLRGVCATADPLQLNATDAGWARRRSAARSPIGRLLNQVRS